MSSKPRDSRGWIVYEGDWAATPDGGMFLVVTAPRLLDYVFLDRGGTGFVCRMSQVTVDPFRSPSRTNYERWFADLGTRDEVGSACYGICRAEARCWCECELDKLVHEAGLPGCLRAFWNWLDGEAVRQ